MIKSVTQHSYFEKKPNKQMGRLQNNPSIRWVHPKSTHAHPLTWGNKKGAKFGYRSKRTRDIFYQKLAMFWRPPRTKFGYRSKRTRDIFYQKLAMFWRPPRTKFGYRSKWTRDIFQQKLAMFWGPLRTKFGSFSNFVMLHHGQHAKGNLVRNLPLNGNK